MSEHENGKDEKWVLLPSQIHGIGVFNRIWLQPGDKIGKGITFALGILPIVTFFGSKINHSYSPTAVLRYDPNDKMYHIYSAYVLPPGTEITIDYRDTPPYIAGPESHYK